MDKAISWLGLGVLATATLGCPRGQNGRTEGRRGDRTAAHTPAPAPATSRAPDDSAPAAAPDLGPGTPGPSTRPVATALRRLLESPDRSRGAEVLAADATWSAPMSTTPVRDRDAVLAALGGGTIAVERIVDLGATRIVLQVGGPSVLVATIADDTVTGIERYGPPVLPARAPAAPASPVRATAVVGGEPLVGNVAVTRKLYDAANAREWDAFAGLVRDGARHVEAGEATDLVRSTEARLADADHRISVRRHFSVGAWVVAEAQITAPVAGATPPGLHRPIAALVDVLRLDHGRIAASWRYVNEPGPTAGPPAPPPAPPEPRPGAPD